MFEFKCNLTSLSAEPDISPLPAALMPCTGEERVALLYSVNTSLFFNAKTRSSRPAKRVGKYLQLRDFVFNPLAQ